MTYDNMPASSPHTISLAQFRQLFPSSSCIGIRDDFCIMDLRYDDRLDILNHPCRFDGYLVFFCISGRLEMTINLKEFEVAENSLFINIPGNIIQITGIESSQKDQIRFPVMAMTGEFMSDLKMDIGKLIEKGMLLLDNPSFVLSQKEKDIAEEYLHLAESILGSNLMYKRECIRSMLSSVFYLAGGVIETKIMEKGAAVQDTGTERSKVVFDRFMNLVSEYHMEEHSVAFYADRLCLSPKYLSKLIKSASGRSASDWIDSYVILEAKNMLRYSDAPVKEIAARLDFPDPASFHKFFKARTGMTPTQYRRS